MAKVRLEGAVKVEFEVKFGLNEDLELKIHKIDVEVDGKQYKVLVGEGDISDIPAKTLEFIGSRIQCFLKEDKTIITVTVSGSYVGFHTANRKFAVSGETEAKFYEAVMNTELGKLMLKTYGYRDGRRDFVALKEAIERNVWFLSIDGMKEFCRLKDWYASKSHIIEKYINKGDK